jgi:hypothetical protein
VVNYTYDSLNRLLSAPTTGNTAPTIRYDNSTLAGNGVNASSLTFSHTTDAATRTNSVIILGVQESTTGSCTSDKVTGATYNGTSLTDMGYLPHCANK